MGHTRAQTHTCTFSVLLEILVLAPHAEPSQTPVRSPVRSAVRCGVCRVSSVVSGGRRKPWHDGMEVQACGGPQGCTDVLRTVHEVVRGLCLQQMLSRRERWRGLYAHYHGEERGARQYETVAPGAQPPVYQVKMHAQKNNHASSVAHL